MAEVEHMIQIYHTGKIVCFSVAAIFFVVSVALFFLFRIPSIFSARTGRGRKKAVRQMQEINAKTGRLRRTEEMEVPGAGIRTNVKITGAAPPEPQASVRTQTDGTFRNAEHRQPAGSEETDILGTDLLSAGVEETSLLQHGDAAETELLQQPDSATALLQPDCYGETGLLNDTDRLQPQNGNIAGRDENRYPIRFVIEKSIMVVNSNEII